MFQRKCSAVPSRDVSAHQRTANQTADLLAEGEAFQQPNASRSRWGRTPHQSKQQQILQCYRDITILIKSKIIKVRPWHWVFEDTCPAKYKKRTFLHTCKWIPHWNNASTLHVDTIKMPFLGSSAYIFLFHEFYWVAHLFIDFKKELIACRTCKSHQVESWKNCPIPF